MYHRIKRRIKTSRLVQYTLFLIFAIIIALLPYNGQPELKQWEINEVHSLKDCIVVMGLPPTTDECAAKLNAPLQEVMQSAERVSAFSQNENEKGWAAILMANYTGAKEHLSSYFLQNQNKTEALKDLAYTHMALREFGKAAELCEEEIKVSPNDTFCLDVLGIAYYTMDRNTDAFANGKKAMELEPVPCREFNLGLYSAGIGNISGAKDLIDKMLKQHVDIVMRCWSPVRPAARITNMSRYNLCFLNSKKTESICRSFTAGGWQTNKLKNEEEAKMPEPIVSMPQGGARLL